MTEKKPPGFMIYQEALVMFAMASNVEAGKIIKAAAAYFLEDYSLNNSVSEISAGASSYMYKIIREGIDRGKQEYQKKCERNRANVNKRWNRS